MSTLDYQLSELYDWSISGHGYWLKNHSSIIGEALKGYIVRWGLEGVKKQLSDRESPIFKYIYNAIEKARA